MENGLDHLDAKLKLCKAESNKVFDFKIL